MEYYLRIQNLPSAADIPVIVQFFSNFEIPKDGIRMVGGQYKEAHINFHTLSDLLKAIEQDKQLLLGQPVKILLAKTGEFVPEPTKTNQSEPQGDSTSLLKRERSITPTPTSKGEEKSSKGSSSKQRSRSRDRRDRQSRSSDRSDSYTSKEDKESSKSSSRKERSRSRDRRDRQSRRRSHSRDRRDRRSRSRDRRDRHTSKGEKKGSKSSSRKERSHSRDRRNRRSCSSDQSDRHTSKGEKESSKSSSRKERSYSRDRRNRRSRSRDRSDRYTSKGEKESSKSSSRKERSRSRDRDDRRSHSRDRSDRYTSKGEKESSKSSSRKERSRSRDRDDRRSRSRDQSDRHTSKGEKESSKSSSRKERSRSRDRRDRQSHRRSSSRDRQDRRSRSRDRSDRHTSKGEKESSGSSKSAGESPGSSRIEAIQVIDWNREIIERQDERVERGMDEDNESSSAKRGWSEIPGHIMISNLECTVTAKDLREYFAGYEIVYRGICIKLDKHNVNKLVAYIKFASTDDALRALERTEPLHGCKIESIVLSESAYEKSISTYGEEEHQQQSPSVHPNPPPVQHRFPYSTCEPSNLTSEPSYLTPDSSYLSHEPSYLTPEPSNLTPEPSNLSHEPSYLTQESSPFQHEPPYKEHEPLPVQHKPSDVQPEPPTTQTFKDWPPHMQIPASFIPSQFRNPYCPPPDEFHEPQPTTFPQPVDEYLPPSPPPTKKPPSPEPPPKMKQTSIQIMPRKADPDQIPCATPGWVEALKQKDDQKEKTALQSKEEPPKPPASPEPPKMPEYVLRSMAATAKFVYMSNVVILQIYVKTDVRAYELWSLLEDNKAAPTAVTLVRGPTGKVMYAFAQYSIKRFRKIDIDAVEAVSWSHVPLSMMHKMIAQAGPECQVIEAHNSDEDWLVRIRDRDAVKNMIK